MKAEFKKSFQRDLKKIKDQGILDRIALFIKEVDKADNVSKLSELKKITGTKNYYRYRVGDYRIGLEMAKDELIFVRVLHRREIYRYFP
jgi:mRNA interferase RelE/StbE